MSVCARCGAALAAGVCPRCLGAEAEPYTLLTVLGRGGMGEVWRARRPTGEEVAVKFLADALVGRPGFAARFAKESRMLAQVAHPGVVRVLDVGELDGTPYFAMELIEGSPLTTRIPMPAPEALAVIRKLAEALAACHAVGVVHRDVKPQNVLVAGDRVVLVDFGIATSELEATGTLTREGMVMGTPAYLAPEVLAGRPPDARADIWALGVLFHQLLTGQIPGPQLGPTAYGDLIRRALAPWDTRYPDMATLLVDLRAAEAQASSGTLRPEELTLQRAAAGLLTVASALGFAAILECVTPRIVTESAPLVMERVTLLADGRMVSTARFAQGPVLTAVAGFAVGAVAWSLLYGHWRRAGLLTRGGAVPQVRVLAITVLVAFAWAAMRWSLDIRATPIGPFLPVIGGILETACLALFWMGQLERARRGLRILEAWPLLFWMGLALVPPILTLWEYLADWTP